MPGSPSLLILILIAALTPAPCLSAPVAVVADMDEFSVGQQCLDRKQYTSAVKHFNNAVNGQPQNIRYHYARGMATLQLRDAEGALSDFEFCKKNDPKFVIASRDWAAAYRASDRFDESYSYWTQALSETPAKLRFDIYYERARTLVEAEQFQKAIEDYTQAIKGHSDNERYYGGRAECYFALKQYKSAIADYDVQLKNNPLNDGTLMHRGLCYLELGQYDSAIADYTKAILLKPQMAKHYAMRAKAYDRMGDKLLAAKDRAKAREIGEDFKL